MQQVTTKMDGVGTAVVIDIDVKEILSPEFKQYAKMELLGAMVKSSKDAIRIFNSTQELEIPNTPGATIAFVVKSLCKCCADAVIDLVEGLTVELSDETKLNAAMVELFGDMWDPETKNFKEAPKND